MGWWVHSWADEGRVEVIIPDEPMFDGISVIDLLLRRDDGVWGRYYDEVGVQHLSQLLRIECREPGNMQPRGLAWKKADWGKIGRRWKDCEGMEGADILHTIQEMVD
ncbi:hypothetical protein HOY82DRAFT_599683 [Tuber indicum]|nr:hypothetical protein HOY82DRAFT_599683 [Tuber indicum]